MKSWINTLNNNYVNFQNFVEYSNIFNVHERLGYETPLEAWGDNPIIGGSTNPDDFGVASLLEVALLCQPHYEEAMLWQAELEDYKFEQWSMGKNLADLITLLLVLYGDNKLRKIVQCSSHKFAEIFGHDFALTRNGHGSGFWDKEDIWGEYSEYLTNTCHKNFSGYHLEIVDEKNKLVKLF